MLALLLTTERRLGSELVRSLVVLGLEGWLGRQQKAVAIDGSRGKLGEVGFDLKE